MGTVQDWNVGKMVHEYAGMPILYQENDEWKWPHGVRAVQLCHYASIRGPRLIASRQNHETPEHAIPDRRPLEDQRDDNTSAKRQARDRAQTQQQTPQNVPAIL